MTDIEHTARNRRFANAFFAGAKVDDQEPEPRDADTEAQRRFAADLFAPDDPDAEILPGITDGRTVGRWRHPEPEPDDKGPWYDRRPTVDD
ncbi:RNA polymerase subunit sigma [Mycobacterium intracellulare]|uniref:RNA polymerase subunit sigma n=1 Tax=Mycobacterium intracellulare TaxID=1767 RepID=UPI003558D2DD